MRNQILFGISDFTNPNTHKKSFNFFHIIFLFCIIIITFCVIYLLIEHFKNKKSIKLSDTMSDRYSLSQIYSDYSVSDNSLFIGSISIPKIDINYPIIYTSNSDFLKIAPCKFYGPNPNEYGNFCIAGHNYNDSRFFSKIKYLESNDSIFITDSSNKTLEYVINTKKEVSSTDTSVLSPSRDFVREVTLITCTNKNNNRIIITAYEKKK